MEIKICLTNLGKYNEGELVGKWFTLPTDIDDAKEIIGINEEYEEWFISDYEAPFTIDENEDLDYLNDAADALADFDDVEDILRQELYDDEEFEDLLPFENNEEFFETYFSGKPLEVARSVFYGDYRFMDNYVRFDGYGNLESLSDYQLTKEIEDRASDIIQAYLAVAV